jgi:hypothetical protein
MALKCKTSDAGNSGMPRTSHTLSEKMKAQLGIFGKTIFK